MLSDEILEALDKGESILWSNALLLSYTHSVDESILNIERCKSLEPRGKSIIFFLQE